MARKDCPDCHGTGEIETESVILGRSYFRKDGRRSIEVKGLGDWQMTQCPCVGEEESDR